MLGVRIPGWSQDAVISVCGLQAEMGSILQQGYACIEREWNQGDTVVLDLRLKPVLVKAHPRVRADIGKASVQYGPLVYCFEEADNGPNLPALSLKAKTPMRALFEPDLLDGVISITLEGARMAESGWENGDQYRPLPDAGAMFPEEPAMLRAVPYYAWSNRGVGEMAVWMRVKD
jgi:DUF1680 family protein